MRRIGILMACGAMLLAVPGCDDGRGGTDAGGIVLMDSGPRVDSGTPMVDSGGGTTFPTSCTVSGFTALPATCTPRCSSATLATANACMDTTCFFNALDADTVPAATLNGPGGTTMLDCSGCVGWQIQTCWAESCPSEFMAWATCDPMGDCTAVETALDACLMTNQTAVGACADPRINQCFATTSGFLPNLEPHRFPHVDFARLDSFAERYGHDLF